MRGVFGIAGMGIGVGVVCVVPATIGVGSVDSCIGAFSVSGTVSVIVSASASGFPNIWTIITDVPP